MAPRAQLFGYRDTGGGQWLWITDLSRCANRR
jgi:hypothetical protein